jgi:hypothetical protein
VRTFSEINAAATPRFPYIDLQPCTAELKCHLCFIPTLIQDLRFLTGTYSAMGRIKEFHNRAFQHLTAIKDLLLRFWIFLCETVRGVIHGAQQEERQVVVQSNINVIRHCSIHILPICTTITIAYFNLAGYFIGENLNGSVSTLAQNMGRLSLQFAAKLFVRMAILCKA